MSLTKLISLLLFWISNNTSYDTSKFDYKVNIVDKKVIQEIVCNGKCPIVAYFGPEQGVLLSKGDYDDACFQSILLHEIIHALQFQSEKKIEYSFKELEAYSLQLKYLEDYSKKNDLLKPLNLKSCRSNQHNILF
jgi:hypothetical protein